ncbi:hypothetical protein [Priestia filamentosa]|uniref:hypothetical protein n=1 Tax=Priestia filamentosa TaxID=1402861 RepID=UPI00036509C8|nr:hypothetical protein [Priestia filamentosa]
MYKEEAAVSELESGFYLGSPKEEAINFWVEIAQNFIINVVKVTNNSVNRSFILVNDNFAEAEHPKIAFAELQFEWKTEAGFSHVIWEDDDHTNLAKEEILSKWFNNLSTEIKTQSLDSNTKLSWYS